MRRQRAKPNAVTPETERQACRSRKSIEWTVTVIPEPLADLGDTAGGCQTISRRIASGLVLME